MSIVKLSSKNQIVLPRQARDAMHVKAHDELLVVVKGATTIIAPKPKNYRKALSGVARGLYGEDYLKKERRSW